MKLKTSKGFEYNVDWADGPTRTSGALMIQMHDDRSLYRIAAEFDGLEKVERESETQGNKEWNGYTELTRIARVDDGVVVIALNKPVE